MAHPNNTLRRALLALTLLVALLAGPWAAGLAQAGQPAPLPTQIPIRDISAPPTPDTPPRPFYSRPAPTRRHVKKTRRHRARPAPQRPAAKPATPAKAASGPTLEHRYEAPTESIIPLESLGGPAPATSGKTAGPKAASGPKPAVAPVALPPEPQPTPAPAAPPAAAPSPATAAPSAPQPAAAPAPAPTPTPTPAK